MPKPNQKPEKPPTPFELALAAKQKKIKPEQLSGASRLLYRQFSEDQLKRYVRGPAEPKPKAFGRQQMRRNARSV